jgi:diguanylate cyclase (GGDEF)-like protein
MTVAARVRMSGYQWRGWLRSSVQTTTLLGLALIALCWGGVEFYLGGEYARAQLSAIQDTTNIARLFEDHIVRVMKSNDRILRQLQLSSVNDTLLQDFNRLAADLDVSGNYIVQMSVTDAGGRITMSNLGPLTATVDLSDREHFKVHARSAEAGLFISKPVLGRTTGQWSIQLTRALRTPHGAFAGIAILSISADKLAHFYEIVEVGRGGMINLVGRDGIVRASAGKSFATVGKSMLNTELLRSAAKADEGWFRTPGLFDGFKRITSFRVVDGYPLILSVGRAESEIFASSGRRDATYRTLAACVTLFILIVIAVNIRHHRGLEIARAERGVSEERAREKSHELEVALENMSQGIMMIDADLNIPVMNRRLVELLDLPQSFLAARHTLGELYAHLSARGESATDGHALPLDVRDFIEDPDRRVGGYERERPDGTIIEVRSRKLDDGGMVSTVTDITERKRSENKIAHMAEHDPLTGLANRMLLRRHIETALARQRRRGESFALLMIDLDHFKAVNDTLGHKAGDTLLNLVAQRLRSCVRELDSVARLGGDEFAILQAATETRENVQTLARRIVEAVSAPYTIDGSPVVIGTSIGIARSHDSPDVEQLFHNADLALYRVKSEGRNNFRLFEPEMDATAKERRNLEADLRAARGRGEFEIYYQPIFSVATGKVASVEALLRWNHATRGRLSPAEFMPLAEEIGLMASIDAWVLEAATKEAVRWAGGVRVAVNLSPAKFKRRDFVAAVQRALADSGLPPQRLELEISEQILLQEEGGNIEALHALHAFGVRIALDDFGTGYSTLSDLRLFAFDKIKIDQSFVADLEMSKEAVAIVAAIADLGRSLGVDTTAEGIETPAQAELARAAGCTEAQGYLFSRALSAGGIAALLREAAAERQVVA